LADNILYLCKFFILVVFSPHVGILCVLHNCSISVQRKVARLFLLPTFYCCLARMFSSYLLLFRVRLSFMKCIQRELQQETVGSWPVIRSWKLVAMTLETPHTTRLYKWVVISTLYLIANSCFTGILL